MSSFHERQKSLFNHLKDAEEQAGFCKSTNEPKTQDYGIIDKQRYRKLKHDMKQFRGRESIYKRKEANLRECLRAKTVPDFIKNPQNWMYYSLSDVTPEQMSDSTNTATALAFIKEMEDKEENMQMEPETDETGVFKKPTFLASKTLKNKPKEENEKPIYKSNKLIMPEYVVGVTKKKERKNKVVKPEPQGSPDNAKKIELKLNHLFEEDDEE